MNIPKDILDWPVDHAARWLWDSVLCLHTTPATAWDDLDVGTRDGFRATLYVLTKIAIESAQEIKTNEYIADLEERLQDANQTIQEQSDDLDAFEAEQDAFEIKINHLQAEVATLKDEIARLSP